MNNKEYFIEKLNELNNNNKLKIKNIIEILIKCEKYEEIIENNLNILNKEQQYLLLLQKQIDNLFDSICNDINLS